MTAPAYWTKAERNAIDRSNIFATITGAETFRALATVDALEKALRSDHASIVMEQGGFRHGKPSENLWCETCDLLAMLEGK